MSFSFINLVPEVLKSLNELGYVNPTPIQKEAIPKILEGHDILASAQTGSGKTAAFLLPALNMVKISVGKNLGPKILILVPTRELAMQVATQATKYSKYMHGVKTVVIYGGTPYPPQNRQLSRPYEILVATPGRLIDHLEQGRINLSQIQMFILDEADRMLDMGFIKPVEQIASKLTKGSQTLMFSATFDKEIFYLAEKLLQNPCRINVGGHETKKHENITQSLYLADNLQHKLNLLDHLLSKDPLDQTIVFTSTKAFAEELGSILKSKGFSTGMLHGDLHQSRRSKTIQQLREGKISVLVATDVAARGIDIPSISYVINFDLPNTIQDYIHRIGRTGRLNTKGTALSFALSRDRHLVNNIVKLTNNEASILTVPGLEPSPKGPLKKRMRNDSRNQSFRGRYHQAKPRKHWGKPRKALSE